MTDKNPTSDPQRRIAAATAIGVNALKPMLRFQVSLLRMWADSVERLVGNYEKQVQEAADRRTFRQGTRCLD
ncbi:hypothetical protein [Bradyrhizobium sp. UFLA05-112]